MSRSAIPSHPEHIPAVRAGRKSDQIRPRSGLGVEKLLFCERHMQWKRLTPKPRF